MGYFGYMCNGCKTPTNGDERVVLKHFRHGELLGETCGTYNGYGGVEEDEIYRGDNEDINGHMSIWHSEFKLLDSKFYHGKIYKGEPLQWMEYREKKVTEGMEDLCAEMYAEWDSLPDYQQKEVLSGTGAWHEYCHHYASEEQKNALILSESDPNQSWGEPRTRFATPVVIR